MLNGCAWPIVFAYLLLLVKVTSSLRMSMVEKIIKNPFLVTSGTVIIKPIPELTTSSENFRLQQSITMSIILWTKLHYECACSHCVCERKKTITHTHKTSNVWLFHQFLAKFSFHYCSKAKKIKTWKTYVREWKVKFQLFLQFFSNELKILNNRKLLTKKYSFQDYLFIIHSFIIRLIWTI